MTKTIIGESEIWHPNIYPMPRPIGITYYILLTRCLPIQQISESCGYANEVFFYLRSKE